jgi:hypothetical protein
MFTYRVCLRNREELYPVGQVVAATVGLATVVEVVVAVVTNHGIRGGYQTRLLPLGTRPTPVTLGQVVTHRSVGRVVLVEVVVRLTRHN